MRILDISRPVGPGVWTWPGDREFSHGLTGAMAEGASCNVGWVSLSCHAGTHVDAPWHFDPQGEKADAIPLAHCLGPCVVTTLERLGDARDAERVLVKAGGAAPTVAQLEPLQALKLFGTDWHSVDPLDSKTLDAHHALRRKGAVILEELLLDHVAEGAYELIALPVKLAGMDGAPVRAVLIAR